MLKRAPSFLQLYGRQHGHGRYASDGDREAGEGTVIALLEFCPRHLWSSLDIHSDREHLTGRLRGISGDDPVRFEGNGHCEACKESRRM